MDRKVIFLSEKMKYRMDGFLMEIVVVLKKKLKTPCVYYVLKH